MSWLDTHSICDLPTAQRANMSGTAAFDLLGVVAGDLTTVATAQAACATGEATKSICDRIFSTQCQRGFKVASNLGFTFASTTAAFSASGPAPQDHRGRMICF